MGHVPVETPSDAPGSALRPCRVCTSLSVLLGVLLTTLADPEPLKVLILGTSITAGYGVESDEAYPALLRSRLDGTGRSFDILVRGEPGSTTNEIVERLRDVDAASVRVLVMEMGANDALLGLPVEMVERNLLKGIQHARRRWPGVQFVLLEVRAPPERSAQYRRRLHDMYVTLSETDDVALVPKVLHGVAGHPETTLDDGLHPNASGHRLVAQRVWKAFRATLGAALP